MIIKYPWRAPEKRACARLDIALPRLVPPTRETPRVGESLPEIAGAAQHLAEDLRGLGPWAKPFADRAAAIASAAHELADDAWREE